MGAGASSIVQVKVKVGQAGDPGESVWHPGLCEDPTPDPVPGRSLSAPGSPTAALLLTLQLDQLLTAVA